MTLALLVAENAELTDAFVKGGPFALGAGAVLVLGKLGWIRFPPAPEQVAATARLEAQADTLIASYSTVLQDAIFAIRKTTETIEHSTIAAGRTEAALERLVRAAGDLQRTMRERGTG